MTDAARATSESDDPLAAIRRQVVEAALPHVPFDGWSDRTLAYAVDDADIDASVARIAFPRGGVDLALAYHYSCDDRLAERLEKDDLLGLRFRDRVAHAIAVRLEMLTPDREAVRRAAALFSLPPYAADGTRAIWHTADTICRALGHESRDYNWYTKRATLAGVYTASLLYWLGDESPDMEATRGFIRRRVDDVMKLEDVKARIRENPVASVVLKGPQRLLDRIRPPDDSAVRDLPGIWRRRS